MSRVKSDDYSCLLMLISEYSIKAKRPTVEKAVMFLFFSEVLKETLVVIKRCLKMVEAIN